MMTDMSMMSTVTKPLPPPPAPPKPVLSFSEQIALAAGGLKKIDPSQNAGEKGKLPEKKLPPINNKQPENPAGG